MSLRLGAPVPFTVNVAPLPGERFSGLHEPADRLKMGGGRAGFRPNMRKHPTIESLSKSTDGKSFTISRSPNVSAYERLQTSEPQENICGRHFLFYNKLMESSRPAMPRRPKDYLVTRAGNLQPFTFPKELSHSPPARPFTLGNHEGCQLNTNPHILSLTTLVLKGRNTFPVDHGKTSRPRVNPPAYSAPAVKDDQKGEMYRDPVLGASRSFIQRISELSTLECETVRHEKVSKAKKCRRNPS